MNVKEAIQLAKEYFVDVFADEKITHLGLEEIKFDDYSKTWKITIGFFPEWQRPAENTMKALFGDPQSYGKRSYKVIEINDEDGEVISIMDRLLNSAN